MGCFGVLQCMKKNKFEHFVSKRPMNLREDTSAALPEPETCRPTLKSAPPSFRNRSKSGQSTSGATYSRVRVLSAPSSLVVADRDAFVTMEPDDHEDSKVRIGLVKDECFANPLPLPLPSPQGNPVLKNVGSSKSIIAGSLISSPGPLPLPPLGGGGIRNFSFEEISAACQHFSVDRCVSEGMSSTVYKATFGDDTLGTKKLEATVTRLLPSSQGLKEFCSEVNMIASLQHPQLCQLLGFHARESSEQRMLVYERLFHGSLDRLLHGRSDGPSIDWCSRMKVALCAAQGLAFLHEEGPFQTMYNEFSTACIQVDKDFSAKLSCFGCASCTPETENSNATLASANLSVETTERGLVTPKSNVWSFGIVLLELLMGRKNLDSQYPKEERNLVKWSRAFLTDDYRLSLVIDPRVKGRFPPKAARIVADVALKCLQKDPSERPTMRTIVEALKNVQDMKYPCRYPLQEPSAINGKVLLKSPSYNGTATPVSQLKFSPSHTSRMQPPILPSSSTSATIPQTCSTTLSREDNRISAVMKLQPPMLLTNRVEGF